MAMRSCVGCANAFVMISSPLTWVRHIRLAAVAINDGVYGVNASEVGDEIAWRLEAALADMPPGFHDSFAFTQTGRNLTHPVTWGLLARVLWEMPRISRVAIDCRLNLGGGTKFQPDLAGLAGLDARDEMVLFVDYESPNSSDARVPVKDVDTYLAWSRACGSKAPYIVVTTLPNCRVDGWELRYATSTDHWNVAFRGRRDEVRRNPCSFWYAFYHAEFAKREMRNVALIQHQWQECSPPVSH